MIYIYINKTFLNPRLVKAMSSECWDYPESPTADGFQDFLLWKWNVCLGSTAVPISNSLSPTPLSKKEQLGMQRLWEVHSLLYSQIRIYPAKVQWEIQPEKWNSAHASKHRALRNAFAPLTHTPKSQEWVHTPVFINMLRMPKTKLQAIKLCPTCAH